MRMTSHPKAAREYVKSKSQNTESLRKSPPYYLESLNNITRYSQYIVVQEKYTIVYCSMI